MPKKPTIEALRKRVKEMEKELKRAQKDLQDGEETYRRHFENASDVIFSIDPEFRILSVSPSAEKIIGFKPEELTGRSFPEMGLLSGEYLESAISDVKRVLEGEPMPSSVYEFVAKDGSRKFGEVSAAPLSRNGKIVGLTCVARDITDRKKAEMALMEREERYRTILESIKEGYYETDNAGNFIFVNDAFCKITGHSSDRLIGSNYRRYTNPESAKLVYETFNEVYQRGKSIEGFDWEMVKKDGTKRHLELSISLMLDSEGHRSGFRGIVRDVTSRKMAEETIREREEKYRNILESIEEGYFEVDLAGNMTFCNDSLFRISGYTKEELLGKNNREYTTPETANRMYEVFSQIYRTGESASVRDYEIIMKDGDKKILEMSASLMRNPSGEPVGFRGLVRDVTQRKRAEAELKESEEKYRQLVEHAPSGIYEIDFVERRFISVNDVMCEYTGYTREELLSTSPFEILTEDSKQRFMERLSKILGGEKVPDIVEYKIKRKDGKEIWVILNSKMVYENGIPKGATVVVHDITERKLAEEAVRESEEKYRLLVDNANDGIFIAQDGVIKFPNPKTKEVLGYSEEELSQIQYLDLIHPEDRRMVSERQQRRREGEELPTTYTIRIMNKAGEQLWTQINAVPITWEGGPATLNFVRDITPQKKLEAQLLQAQKMEAIGTMASGVGHNFRNILAVISMQSQILQMKYPDSHALQEIADGINTYVERGAQLIEGLMQFSRKQTKKKYQPLNLADLIRETHQLISISFDKMIDIRIRIPESIPVTGDHSELSQVLMNLFTNARDAMPEGGELCIEAQKEGNRAVVIISDTGAGMDKETQERCFDPFFTTKEVDKGTGLGLSTTYGIVKEHGGDIQVKSTPDQGTTFNISLPLSSSDDLAAQGSSRPMKPGKGEKILIVDDEMDMCRVMEELLKRLGYEAASVNGGSAAIVKYKSWRPDVVLLDRNMPEMDGISCAESIVDYDPGAKIVIISGYDENGPSGMVEEKKRLIKGYLTKPIGMAKLSTQLARVLK